ncbi:MAG: 50S ribosomal protein L21 [Bacteroidota bacterium]
MYAVVEIAGQQFKVAKNDKIDVPRLDNKTGDTVTFDKVLLLDTGKAITIGAPGVSGAKVQAKVLEHSKEDTVVVFKKKKRKGYRIKNGHRQGYTQIEILNIA